MRFAVISDIHSNFEALNAVLGYIHQEKIDKVICLGDVVGYGPHPNQCVDLVKERCERCLMGNHDYAALGPGDLYYFNDYARESILWTRRRLTKYNLSYLENLPFTIIDDMYHFVHSSPLLPEEWHYIFDEVEAKENFDAVDQPLIFVGHSHMPVVFSEKNGPFFEMQTTLDLNHDRYIVNVGSVGQPRDGDPRASFVIFDTDLHQLQYVRIQYDVEKTFQEILQKELPAFLAMRLLVGQ